MVQGEYVFSDGLKYVDPAEGDWDYCRADGDRRFYSERIGGLRPAGDSQITNLHPPHRIPVGTYDTGDGYFNEADGKVYDYEGEVLRDATHEEEKWIKAKCRMG